MAERAARANAGRSAGAADRPPTEGDDITVGYLVSRFPKLTETFVLYELLAVEELGVRVELYPLRREPAPLLHPEAAALVERAHFTPLLSRSILSANLHWLIRRPRAYLGALWTVLAANWGSRRFLGGTLAIFPQAAFLARRMVADGITHVHAHFASFPTAAAFVVHRLTGLPYSFTAHGSDLHRDQHMLCEKVADAAAVVTISQFNRELILAHCGAVEPSKVTVVHCGVDTAVFHPPDGAQWVPGNGHAGLFTILCAGTLHEVKGQAYLVEACRLLAERGTDVRCQLVGDGEDRSDLERRIAHGGLDGRVELLGLRTRVEVAELMRRADVVAAPSVPTCNGRREGIPVALMEAMASGRAVVASDLSGIPELVADGRTGLLVPPGDAVALAGALERLARDPGLRDAFGHAGRERVLAEFDLQANAARLVQIFRGSPR